MSVVVITGCSSGLGRLTALAFARRGDRVYATMRRSERGRELVDTARAEGADVRFLDLDVTNDDSVEQAIGAILDAEGRIDVLVNNAGLLHYDSVELLPDALMRRDQPFRPRPAAANRSAGHAPAMVRGDRQRLVRRRPGSRLSHLLVVLASKYGLNALSDALAKELEPHGIRVISIEPGFFHTPIAVKGWRSASGDSPYQELDEAVVAFVEGGVSSGGDAQEIADALVDAVIQPDGPVGVSG